MRFLKTVFIAALFSFGAPSAHACAVDAVYGKTDTTITISWDLSGCKHVNSGQKFEICWKKSGNSGNVCIPPTIQRDTLTGTATIEGLSPSTAYKIRTKWHKKSSWYVVTTRTVTTNPTPTSSATVLRYEKGSGQPYCVDFYWKNLPAPPVAPNQDATLALHLQHRFLGPIGGYVSVAYNAQDHDLTNISPNSATNEYTKQLCIFNNNRRYRAYIYWRKDDQSVGRISNIIEWK